MDIKYSRTCYITINPTVQPKKRNSNHPSEQRVQHHISRSKAMSNDRAIMSNHMSNEKQQRPINHRAIINVYSICISALLIYSAINEKRLPYIHSTYILSITYDNDAARQNTRNRLGGTVEALLVLYGTPSRPTVLTPSSRPVAPFPLLLLPPNKQNIINNYCTSNLHHN